MSTYYIIPVWYYIICVSTYYIIPVWYYIICMSTYYIIPDWYYIICRHMYTRVNGFPSSDLYTCLILQWLIPVITFNWWITNLSFFPDSFFDLAVHRDINHLGVNYISHNTLVHIINSLTTRLHGVYQLTG